MRLILMVHNVIAADILYRCLNRGCVYFCYFIYLTYVVILWLELVFTLIL